MPDRLFTVLLTVLILVLSADSSHAEKRLYVVQSLDESLGQVNLETNIITPHVLSLCYLPNDVIQYRGKLYVANSGCNTVQEIDPTSNATEREISLDGGVNPWSITALNPDTLAVSCSVSNNVILVRLSDGVTVGSLSVGLSPEGILALDDYLLVTLTRLNWPNYGPGVVMIYNRTSLQLLDSIAVGINPQFMAPDSRGRLHVVCTGNYGTIPGQINVINMADLSSIAVLPIGGTPSTVAFGGDLAFVAGGGWQGSGVVFRYRLNDLDILNDVSNPVETGGGAFDVEGLSDSSFFVSCFSANTIEHRSSDGQLLQNYPVSAGPGFMVTFVQGNSGIGNSAMGQIPTTISTLSAYPNPFNGTVCLKFDGPQRESQQIVIINLLGQHVAMLTIPAGKSEVAWTPSFSTGNLLSSGIYYAVPIQSAYASGIRLNFIK